MSYETPNLNVALRVGNRSEALNLQTPRDNFNVQSLSDYALTRDQTLRIAANRNATGNRKLGVGAFDSPERAYESHDSFRNFRVRPQSAAGRYRPSVQLLTQPNTAVAAAKCADRHRVRMASAGGFRRGTRGSWGPAGAGRRTVTPDRARR